MTFNFIHMSRVFSIFLSSSGFWMNNHYCQNELTGPSFFVILGSSCSNESDSCSTEKKSSYSENNTDKCCDTKSEFDELDQDLLITKTEFKYFEKYKSFNVILLVKEWHLSIVNRNNYKYYKYLLPLIVFDYQVRLQTFLC